MSALQRMLHGYRNRMIDIRFDDLHTNIAASCYNNVNDRRMTTFRLNKNGNILLLHTTAMQAINKHTTCSNE